MIENHNQYQVTTQQLAKLRAALAGTPDEPPDNVHPVLHEASKQGLRVWIGRLESDLAEWEVKQNTEAKHD